MVVAWAYRPAFHLDCQWSVDCLFVRCLETTSRTATSTPSCLVLPRFSSGLFRAMFAMKEIEWQRDTPLSLRRRGLWRTTAWSQLAVVAVCPDVDPFIAVQIGIAPVIVFCRPLALQAGDSLAEKPVVSGPKSILNAAPISPVEIPFR